MPDSLLDHHRLQLGDEWQEPRPGTAGRRPLGLRLHLAGILLAALLPALVAGALALHSVADAYHHAFEARLRDYAALRGELTDLQEAGQADVDRVFGRLRSAGPAPVSTPKGIAPETLDLVRKVLGAAGPDGLSATACSDRTGLARVSARRYLEQLVTVQEADVRQRYGTAGRPERRFTLRSARRPG